MPKVKYQSYFICTSPRSGSTLLCKLLANTGVSGAPDSHFHNPSLSGWLKAYELSREDFACEHDALKAVFDAARARGTGNSGVFGLRIQRGSFEFFIQQVGILQPGLGNDLERIEAVFGHTLFIHLTRRNKLDQAISRVKAIQTGLWHRAADGTELERQSPPQEPVYDADEIELNLKALTLLDEAWQRWFDREKIAPLTITYDELSADPGDVLASILCQLGQNHVVAGDIKLPVAKLADATSRRWVARFQAERARAPDR